MGPCARSIYPFALAAIATTQFGTVQINWVQGNGIEIPEVSIGHYDQDIEEEVPPTPTPMDSQSADERPPLNYEPEKKYNEAAAPTASSSTDLADVAIPVLRALLQRLRNQPGNAPAFALKHEDVHTLSLILLQRHTFAAMRAVRPKLLRILLEERGARCENCIDKDELIGALVTSLKSPPSSRHALMLFGLHGHFLFPHSEMHMHIFEPRYKLVGRGSSKPRTSRGFLVSMLHASWACSLLPACSLQSLL